MGEQDEDKKKKPIGVRGVKSDYWKFTQWFRKMQNNQPLEEGEQDHDHITSVQFDDTGRFLATGDKSGNIVVLESDPSKSKKGIHYSFYSEFVSHNPDFDFVKSEAVAEKINTVKFGPTSHEAMYLLTTNKKQIKLWKVTEKEQYKVQGWNIDPSATSFYYTQARSPLNTTRGKPVVKTLKVPKKIVTETTKMPTLRKMYADDVHAYDVSTLSVMADKTSFLSGDNLRINLWDMNIETHAYNVLDVKPEDMNELSEIISSADAHPSDSNIFLYSTSLGNIMTCDLRVRALVDEPAQVFAENADIETGDADQEQQTFFSEMTQNITSAKFSKSGKYIFSRDYMTVKIWDTAMETEPIQTIYVHEYLRPKMWDLYSNDLLWDPFTIGIGSKGDIVTGTYSNHFHIFDLGNSTDTFVQASQQATKTADLFRSRKKRADPVMPSEQPPAQTERNRKGSSKGFGLGMFHRKKKAEDTKVNPMADDYPFDMPFENIEFSKKIIDCAWHPESDAVAVAGQNNLYIYSKMKR